MINLSGHADVYLLDNPYNVADAQAGWFLQGMVLETCDNI
jgi:hypothetical protein